MFSQSPGPRVGFHTCLPDNTSNAPYLIPIFYKTIVPDISLNINHYMILKKTIYHNMQQVSPTQINVGETCCFLSQNKHLSRSSYTCKLSHIGPPSCKYLKKTTQGDLYDRTF